MLVLQWAHSVLVRRTQTERAWSVIQDLQRRTCDVPAPRFQRSMGARGRALHKPSRPAGEHSLFNRPAQRAVDPPHLRRCQHSMGARSAPSRAAASQSREANDVPGSSTRTARTQSDVRSFRLDVWRIIIALRAATSLDLGRAALQCGGVVSRASCVAVCVPSCTYSYSARRAARDVISRSRPTLARLIRPRSCAMHVWNRSLSRASCHVLQLLSCQCQQQIMRCISRSMRADVVADQPPARKCQLTAKIMDASLRTETQSTVVDEYMATKVVF